MAGSSFDPGDKVIVEIDDEDQNGVIHDIDTETDSDGKVSEMNSYEVFLPHLGQSLWFNEDEIEEA